MSSFFTGALPWRSGREGQKSVQVAPDVACSRAWGEAPTVAAASLGQASIPRLGASWPGPSGHVYVANLYIKYCHLYINVRTLPYYWKSIWRDAWSSNIGTAMNLASPRSASGNEVYSL